MTDKERSKMIDQIGNYILMRQFAKHDTDVAEALTVLCAVVDQIIRSLCNVCGHDAEDMITCFCNGLQGPLEKERHYSTGSEEGDELMQKVVDELKAGNDIEEIVDKYINCETPEIRQEIIDGMRGIRDRHSIDNVKIGYNKGN